jgi:hypothetical protein
MLKPLLEIVRMAVERRWAFVDNFTYTATWNTLGASATTAQSTAVDAAGDFLVEQLNLVSYSAAGTKVSNPDYLLDLKDSGAGRLLSDSPVHVGNITGDVKISQGFMLPQPKLIKGGTKITATLQNLTATAARVDLAYVGFHLYYLQTEDGVPVTRRMLFGVA